MSELEGECREDLPEVAPVVEIARTKKAGAKLPVCEARLCKRLGNGRLSSSGETVEPVHMLLFLAVKPGFELGKDIFPSPLHASLPVPTEVSRVGDMGHPIEKREVRPVLFAGHCVYTDAWGTTHNELTTFVVDILLQRRLTQRLGKLRVSALRTNLVIHHGITDILD